MHSEDTAPSSVPTVYGMTTIIPPLVDRANPKGRLVVRLTESGLVARLYERGGEPGRDIGVTITPLPAPTATPWGTVTHTIGTPGVTTFSITADEFSAIINSGGKDDVEVTKILPNGSVYTTRLGIAVQEAEAEWPVTILGCRGYFDYATDNGRTIFVPGPYPLERSELNEYLAVVAAVRTGDRQCISNPSIIESSDLTTSVEGVPLDAIKLGAAELRGGGDAAAFDAARDHVVSYARSLAPRLRAAGHELPDLPSPVAS